MRKYILFLAIIFIFSLAYFFNIPTFVHAGNPQSASYKLVDFGFGAGGTASSSSTTYSLFGTAGELSASSSSLNYRLGSGLTYTMIASVPAAPTFTNPSNYYNKLLIKINPVLDPSDYSYAIAISNDGFATDTEYVQSDNTISTNFSVLNFRSFSSWGGTSGTTLIGLTPNKTYTAKVKARQGFYTESPWGATAQAATINPTFSFSVSSSNSNPQLVAIGTINPGTVVTSTDTVTTTMSTNGTSGGTVYLYDANAGLLSSNTGHTISSVTSDLASVAEGYGAQGTTVTQSSGGPMEKLSPYNGSSNNVGIINSIKQPIFDSTGQPVTSGQGTFNLQVKAGNTAPAATDYADTLTVIAASAY